MRSGTIKSTGIVRKIDDLGRIVIPKELRTTMNLKKKDSLEIFVEEDKIILSSYKPGCMFCGNMDNTIEYQDRNICKKCLNKMGKNMK